LAAPDAPGNFAIDSLVFDQATKLSEDLLSPSESLEPTSLPGITESTSPVHRPRPGIDAAFERLASQTLERNLSALLETIREIIPEYEPSAALMSAHHFPVAKSTHHD